MIVSTKRRHQFWKKKFGGKFFNTNIVHLFFGSPWLNSKKVFPVNIKN